MSFLGKDDVATLWDVQIEMVGGDSVGQEVLLCISHFHDSEAHARMSWLYCTT